MLKFLFLVLIICFCSSCTGRIDLIEKDLDRVKNNNSDIRTQLAEHTSDLIEIKDLLRRLSGRVEEIEYQQRTRVGGELSGLKRELSTLRRRVPPPAVVPLEALEEDEAKLSKLKGPASDYLSEALKLIRDAKFRQALVAIQRGLEEQVADSGPELIFWKAVCFDAMSENARAIEAYDEVVRKFPKHPRSALALLRTSSVLNRIGDSNTSRITLKKLINDFPKSLEASVARERLKVQ